MHRFIVAAERAPFSWPRAEALRYFTLALSLFLVCAASAGAREADPRDGLLIDQQGRRFTLADLHGQPVLVTFVATRCTDDCPIVDAVFERLTQRLRREHLRATLVTITLDPQHDTPVIMARVAHELRADPQRWRLASGEPAVVYHLMRAFGVVARPNARGVPDVHSTLVYVLDADVRLADRLLLSSDVGDEALQAARALAPAHPPRS
jgi:cytochrome oxidase Cu insertion factor (SCO1/SenC/PrrC family)